MKADERLRGIPVIIVQDDGRGIAPDHLGRIFDPFFTTQRGQRSIGLGLHIVHNLVINRLGGTIAVECDPDRKGSLFTLRLPLAVARNVDESTDEAADHTHGPSAA